MNQPPDSQVNWYRLSGADAENLIDQMLDRVERTRASGANPFEEVGQLVGLDAASVLVRDAIEASETSDESGEPGDLAQIRKVLISAGANEEGADRAIDTLKALAAAVLSSSGADFERVLAAMCDDTTSRVVGLPADLNVCEFGLADLMLLLFPVMVIVGGSQHGPAVPATSEVQSLSDMGDAAGSLAEARRRRSVNRSGQRRGQDDGSFAPVSAANGVPTAPPRPPVRLHATLRIRFGSQELEMYFAVDVNTDGSAEVEQDWFDDAAA